MRIVRISLLSLLILSLSIPAAFAHATVEQRTTMKLGGFLGRVQNLFGAGRSAKDGIDTLTVVKGDRRVNRTADMAEIVDLKEEKIYSLNAKNKSYTVMTFAELRKQFEDAMKDAEKNKGQESGGKPTGPEYTIDVDVKETGAKETINGYATRQVIVTVSAHEKGKKLEESGGGVLTADLWVGPEVAALDEVASFERRYLQKLYGDVLGGMDFRSLAMLTAMSPGFGDAMKKFQEKSASLKGTPIRSTITYESVAGPAGAKGEEQESGSTLDPA
ncbi:MAG TPA: hypothetical protein VFV54_05160, partial [Thermoanaerobaculia bacterium]|nr:hypothetical protein [Thermoanaerobaculia bacterium]